MHTSGLVWNHAFLLKGDRLREGDTKKENIFVYWIV
jgi:hypothetical protein